MGVCNICRHYEEQHLDRVASYGCPCCTEAYEAYAEEMGLGADEDED